MKLIYDFHLKCVIFDVGPSYHHNRRPMHDRERLERERIERDRERIHARERELAAQYDINDDDILGNRGHAPMQSMPPTSHIRHPNDDREYMRERDRDEDRDRGYPIPMAAHSSHMATSSSSRRTADDYSPHRGGGSRRVHAM